MQINSLLWWDFGVAFGRAFQCREFRCLSRSSRLALGDRDFRRTGPLRCAPGLQLLQSRDALLLLRRPSRHSFAQRRQFGAVVVVGHAVFEAVVAAASLAVDARG